MKIFKLKNITNIFPRPVILTSWAFLILFLNLTLYRVILSFTGSPKFENLELADWPMTFLIGARFDLASAAILTTLAFLIISTGLLIKPRNKLNTLLGFIVPIFFVALISVVDWTFYQWLSYRIDSRFFPYVMEPKLWVGAAADTADGVPFIQLSLLILTFIGFNILILIKSKFVLKISKSAFNLKILPFQILSTLILLGLLFLFIRGKDSFPLRANDFTIHNRSQLNVVSRSPVFQLAAEIVVFVKLNQGSMYSSLMPKKDIIRLREFMGFPSEPKSNNPLEHPFEKCFRKSEFIKKEPPKNPNIIYFVIESLGYVHFKDLPYLNKLAKKSFFMNWFSAVGTSTVDGLWSTMCSILPSLGRQQTALLNNSFQCLPKLLANRGYENYYIFGGNISMDQMGYIAKKNKYHHLIGSDDFPDEERKSFVGIVDDNVLLKRIKKEAKSAKKPFFMYILNSQTHAPHIIPKNYKWPKDAKVHSSYGFLDYYFEKFFKEIEKEDFFKDTIFIITADHSFHSQTWNYTDDPTIGASLWQHRVPLIMYAPHILKAKKLDHFGTQADIPPTVYDILNLDIKLKGWGSSLFCLNEEKQRSILVSRRNRYMTIMKGKKIYSIHLPDFKEAMEVRYNPKEPYEKPLFRYEKSNPQEIIELSRFLYFANRNIIANKFYWN